MANRRQIRETKPGQQSEPSLKECVCTVYIYVCIYVFLCTYLYLHKYVYIGSAETNTLFWDNNNKDICSLSFPRNSVDIQQDVAGNPWILDSSQKLTSVGKCLTLLPAVQICLLLKTSGSSLRLTIRHLWPQTDKKKPKSVYIFTCASDVVNSSKFWRYQLS